MGTLFVVATPIGNLADFSPRGIETLGSCDLILAEDTRQTIKLLNHFSIKTKMVSYHKFNEAKRSEEIIEKLINGLDVALVSDAGTPCVSDPGYVIINQARKAGINVVAIPGCSAVITALSVSGLDTSSFAFYGFVPTINKEKNKLFKDIKESKIKTKVLYESPKRVLSLLKELANEMPGCMVCVCSELTKMHEKSYYGNIEKVCVLLSQDKDAEKGEYVVLIQNEVGFKEKNQELSLEALIVDAMVKLGYSLKEAVNHVSKSNEKLSKKDVYNAGLNLKSLPITNVK